MNTSKRHRRNAQGLDRFTAERMLVGLAADDAPPDYAAVAAVLAAAAAPADESSAALGEYAAVRAYHDAIYATAPVRAERRFQPWRTAAGRIAVFATAGALAMGGGVAAAATGSLPAPAQRVAHQILGGLGVPAVTSSAIPANFDHPQGDTDATTAPGVTVLPSTHTADLSTTEVIPAEAPAPAPATTATTDADDHGKAVSSIAKSADAGPEHGAEVCIVASDAACTTKDRGETHSADEHSSESDAEHSANEHRRKSSDKNSANEHRSESGAEHSANEHRGESNSDKSANKHRADTGAANATGDHHPTDNGDAHSNRSDDGTPEQGATGH